MLSALTPGFFVCTLTWLQMPFIADFMQVALRLVTVLVKTFVHKGLGTSLDLCWFVAFVFEGQGARISLDWCWLRRKMLLRLLGEGVFSSVHALFAKFM